MVPHWLHALATLSVIAAVLSAVVIVIDENAGHRQHMWIMNVVWPMTALWAGPLALVAYYK